MQSPRGSVTKLRIKSFKDLNESVHSKQRGNSNESLERIHTFSLKSSFQKKSILEPSNADKESK